MKTAKIGGYQFNYLFDLKRGAIIHVLVEDNIISKVQNSEGRMKNIEGMSIPDAVHWIKENMHISPKITGI